MSMMICPRCKEEVWTKDGTCPACGHKSGKIHIRIIIGIGIAIIMITIVIVLVAI